MNKEKLLMPRFSSLLRHAFRRSPLVLGVIVASHPAFASAQSNPRAQKPPLVATVTVAPATLSRVLHLTGNVASTNEVSVRSSLDGPIGFCPWREGDTFAKDDKLIEINRPIYAGEVASARAALAVERAKLADLRAGTRPEEIRQVAETVKELEACATFTESDYQRIHKLVEKGSLPAETAEKARVSYVKCKSDLASARERLAMLKAGPTETELAVQEAKVAEAEAKLEVAASRLAETRIAAPFDGIVTAVYARPGDMATAKTPLLDVRERGTLVVRFAVPERDSARLVADVPVVARLDAKPGETFAGKVVRVYPNLDQTSRTRTAEAILTDAQGLAPGMFARLEVMVETVSDALVVPDSAVLVRPGGKRVMAVVENGKAVLRSVRTGIETGRRVQIINGLKPGDQVVTEGNQNLKPGMAVRLHP
jgi:multidrug efflux pump subunit AcrA (membrane-fusion protein)